MSHRTQITLTDAQYRRLLGESERSGRSLAELVRRAVDESYGSTSGRDLLDALDASFDTWGAERGDGAAYVEELRPGMAQRLGGS